MGNALIYKSKGKSLITEKWKMFSGKTPMLCTAIEINNKKICSTGRRKLVSLKIDHFFYNWMQTFFFWIMVTLLHWFSVCTSLSDFYSIKCDLFLLSIVVFYCYGTWSYELKIISCSLTLKSLDDIYPHYHNGRNGSYLEMWH